jgi:quinol monooxygenase YgiN
MPVVVVATFTAKPESVDTAREIMTTGVEEGHSEPGCQLYSLHQTGDSFVFIEQWADEEALTAHSSAPAVAKMFAALDGHLTGDIDFKMLQPLPAGDPDKGQLRK